IGAGGAAGTATGGAADDDGFREGPTGEYLEVVDYDPTVQKFYAPVNLNDPYILAQDGLAPSESNPQFHQQMVYAVAMTTIKNFEMALGRPIMWAPHVWIDKQQGKSVTHYDFVRRLRIYPHAFRDANAYYSPQKKALLFGYFSAQPAEITIQMPNTVVFTCLSHDIIAHETTHAILDGMYRRYIDATNPDTLAFHEGFADIIALFQHFTFPEVLRHQIARTRGDLASQNLLGELAQQFGTAIGSYGALRDAIGKIDEKTKKWVPIEPNGNEYQTTTEPHARGSILVSAVFDAFLAIYKSRAADLLRIASGGTGILAQGELPTDLVNRLASEAAKSARHVLGMCIRALDFCPPVDITFGDYLRGVITADADLVADDRNGYRIAFIDAFRKRGIYPTGIRNLSIESLCYPHPSATDLQDIGTHLSILTTFLREFHTNTIYTTDREKLFNITGDYIGGGKTDTEVKVLGLHRRINMKFLDSDKFQSLTGLVLNRHWADLGIRTSNAYNQQMPSFEVHSLKVASRVGPDGNKTNQIVLTLIQRCGIRKINEKPDGPPTVETCTPAEQEKTGEGFIMTGGCTLIFDLDSTQLKYAISKPLLDIDRLKAGGKDDASEGGKYGIDAARAAKMDGYLNQRPTDTAFQAYFAPKPGSVVEPFALLHQS
ncbi:MAG TPA: hypothetical protein VGQ51_06460, partial [Puia sp.]|nr:hypothetical protein [Puia sp.]